MRRLPRLFAFLALLVAVAAAQMPAQGSAHAQSVPDSTPEELDRHIYAQYVGKGPDAENTFHWTSDETARQLFEPVLAEALIREAEGPDTLIGFDPFVDGQDFRIASYRLEVRQKDARHARLAASFTNMGRPTRIVFELVATAPGWRIRDLSFGAGRDSFRQVLRLDPPPDPRRPAR